MTAKTRTTGLLRAAIVIVAAVLLVGVGVSWWGFQQTIHDKAVNSDSLQKLQSGGFDIPVGVVVPAKNKWVPNAFVAEPAGTESGKEINVLILDDHYVGNDFTLRSANGLIGGDLTLALFCSLPAKAAQANVRLDRVVSTEIAKQCVTSGSE